MTPDIGSLFADPATNGSTPIQVRRVTSASSQPLLIGAGLARVLAIDPGTRESAYVMWDGVAIQKMAKVPNMEIFDVMTGFSKGYTVELCVEMVASYGMPVGREVFQTVLWIGRFIEQWWRMTAREAYCILRMDVKKWFCQDSRAKDANIRQALIDRFGPPGTLKSPGLLHGVSGDIWSAMAIAVYSTDCRPRTFSAYLAS